MQGHRNIDRGIGTQGVTLDKQGIEETGRGHGRDWVHKKTLIQEGA